MARRARLVIKTADFTAGLITTQLMRDIFDALPYGSKLMDTYPGNETIFIIESPSFKDTQGLYPEIDLITSTGVTGEKEFLSLDMTDALNAYQPSLFSQQIAANTPTFLAPNQAGSVPVQYWSPSYGQSAHTGAHQDADNANHLAGPVSCSHKWKDYLGLNERFTYCETCGKKQKNA